MPRPKKQQQPGLSDIFEQLTAQLGAVVLERVSKAVTEVTECLFKGKPQAPEAKAKAETIAKPAAPKRRRRRRKAAKKPAHNASSEAIKGSKEPVQD